MIDERSLAEEIGRVSALQTLVRAYGEIAAIRMRKTRSSVLANREFLDQLNGVFEDVRASYAQEVAALAKKTKGPAQVTFLAHNGKTVSVFISANTGLYGEIVQSTLRLFLEEVRQNISEVSIVGRHGLSLFLAEEPDRPYSYFDLPDDRLEVTQLEELIKHIVQYSEIHVFYGKFQSVITQRPEKLEVSAEISLTTAPNQKPRHYLFEPTLESVLMFFETEIFATNFEQIIRESQLAKFASRVLAMDKADQNTKEEVKKLFFEKNRLRHRSINKKLLNAVSSLIAWGGIR
jgi:ATP synthase F1 gamma subunit